MGNQKVGQAMGMEVVVARVGVTEVVMEVGRAMDLVPIVG